MSEQERTRRPTQVTVALAAVIGGALLLLASGFDSMVNLHSVDLRERLSDAVRSASARSLGLTVDDLIGWMRVAILVTGAAAAAAAVLGWFALQRHRGARVGLAVVAVVLLACAPFAGGVLAAFVAVAIALLWTGQARDWFAGRPVRQRQPMSSPPGAGTPPDAGSPEPPHQPPHQASQPPRVPPDAPSAPAPTSGYGDRRTTAPGFGPHSAAPQQPAPQQPAPQQPAPQQPAPQQPAPPQPAPYPGPQSSWQQGSRPVTYAVPAAHPHASSSPVDQRPGSVLTACVLTWVFSGLTAAVFALVAVFLVAQPDGVVARVEQMPKWQDTGLSASAIQPVLWAAVAFYVAWSLAACLLAWFAWRRHSWARMLLVVSAVGAVVLGIFAFPVSALHVIVCGLVAGLLLGGSAGRWFARSPRQQPARPPRAW